MPRTMASTLLILSSALSAVEGPSSELRLLIGTAAPIDEAEITGINAGSMVPIYKQSFDFDRDYGPHIGLQYLRSNPFYKNLAGYYGLECAYDLHKGKEGRATWNGSEFPNGEDMALHALSLSIHCGLRERIILKNRPLGLYSWSLECGPYLGIGSAYADYSDSSKAGLYHRYGLRLGADCSWSKGDPFSPENRFGLLLGYEFAEADIAWDNTNDSTVSARGGYLLLTAAWQW